MTVVPLDLPSRAPHKPTQNRIFINRRRPRNALPVFVPSCVCGLWWDLSHVHLSLSPSLPLSLSPSRSLPPSLSLCQCAPFCCLLRVSGLRVCLCERVGPREFHPPRCTARPVSVCFASRSALAHVRLGSAPVAVRVRHTPAALEATRRSTAAHTAITVWNAVERWVPKKVPAQNGASPPPFP